MTKRLYRLTPLTTAKHLLGRDLERELSGLIDTSSGAGLANGAHARTVAYARWSGSCCPPTGPRRWSCAGRGSRAAIGASSGTRWVQPGPKATR